jgi:hypothetical protein
MSELVRFLADQFDKEMKEVIEQLNILKSKQRYQFQCSILNHITDKMCEFKTKAETF